MKAASALVSLFAIASVLACVSAPASAEALGPATVLGEESTTDVKATSATLQAQLEPNHQSTSYYFQYGTSAGYGSVAPATPLTVAGEGEQAVSIHVQGLQPQTTYYYRLVAENESGVTEGTGAAFTTTSTGEEFTLPDNRQWELVTPPDEHGFTPKAMSKEGAAIQAAAAGGAITYTADGPLTSEPAANRSPELVQELSERTAAGWQTHDIATPHDRVQRYAIGDGSEYRLFSENLGLAELEPRGETPLSPQTTERTPYLRDGATGEYEPLLTAGNVVAGAKFGGEPTNLIGDVVIGSTTANLSAVGLVSTVPLLSGAIGLENSLYEWTDGKLQPVGVMPGPDRVAAEKPTFGYFNKDVRNAISSDGSRVVWANSPSATESNLYLSDMATRETIQLDLVQPRASGENTATAQFQLASADGSRIFFTDEQNLTPDASPTGSDLYEFHVNEGPGPLSGTLTDVTVPQNRSESAEVKGVVLGASEDGSYLYFLADGILASGAANHENGCVNHKKACNLYVEHDGTTKFISTLAAEDAGGQSKSWGEVAISGNLQDLPTRVSPNGHFLAFMSKLSLTGYDNRDEASGEPDEEVYIYDAETGHLACASCDPTGARPTGAYDTGFEGENVVPLVDEPEQWVHRWLGGIIPGWTGAGEEQAFYDSRYLTNTGRLFFDSPVALVSQDVNKQWDVYEYEPEGVGPEEAKCGPGVTSGSEVFKPPHTFKAEGEEGEESAGCVALISSGTSPDESTFLDASAKGGRGSNEEEGEEVFFLTQAQLTGQGSNGGSEQIYDAHSCSAASPCLSSAMAPTVCDTADSCRAAPAPQPSIFGAPATATFSGPGNSTPTEAKPKASAVKKLTRAQELERALKACAHKPKRRRATCERQAKGKYGSAKKTKKAKKSANTDLRASR